MANYLTPNDSRQIQAALVTFLEANLTDPYEQATGNSRADFVHGESFEIRSTLASPVIQVDLGDFNSEKINSTTKTNFLEEERHSFLIYYNNAKGKLFTFADNGLQLKDKATQPAN